MPRRLKIAAAQMGPNNEGVSREEIVDRMLALLQEAVREGVQLIAYPEMALTTYLPQHYSALLQPVTTREPNR
jgi:N-carbamoyl-D-amino-acid hydrolase